MLIGNRGKTLAMKEQITNYLRALKTVTNIHLLLAIKDYNTLHRNNSPLDLQAIQQDLMVEEEKEMTPLSSPPQQIARRREYRSTPRPPPSRQPTRPSRYAHRVQRTFTPRRTQGTPDRGTLTNGSSRFGSQSSFRGSCYGCNQPGHSLRNCPTTAEEDKQRIYDAKRQERGGDNPNRVNTWNINPRTSAAINPRTSAARFPQQGTAASANTTGARVRPTRNRGAQQSHTEENSRSNEPTHSNSPPFRTRRQSNANVASASSAERRTAYASMARSFRCEDTQCAVCCMTEIQRDTLDANLLRNGYIPEDHDAQEAQLVIYEETVMLDSGASDSMTNQLSTLTLIRPANVQVLLADGSNHDSTLQGLMRIAASDIRTHERVVIPMMDTLFVPGLRCILWSVDSLTNLGHTITFGLSTASITLHAGTDHEISVLIRHPIIHNSEEGFPVPRVLAQANTAQTTISTLQPTVVPIDDAYFQTSMGSVRSNFIGPQNFDWSLYRGSQLRFFLNSDLPVDVSRENWRGVWSYEAPRHGFHMQNSIENMMNAFILPVGYNVGWTTFLTPDEITGVYTFHSTDTTTVGANFLQELPDDSSIYDHMEQLATSFSPLIWVDSPVANTATTCISSSSDLPSGDWDTLSDSSYGTDWDTEDEEACQFWAQNDETSSEAAERLAYWCSTKTDLSNPHAPDEFGRPLCWGPLTLEQKQLFRRSFHWQPRIATREIDPATETFRTVEGEGLLIPHFSLRSTGRPSTTGWPCPTCSGSWQSCPGNTSS
jgi:hypothetical protein